MEWVEFTASSLEEATQLATEQLGLGAGALEIEVLEEPVAGLFGRVRGTAKIRARAAGAKVAKATKSSKAAKPSTTSWHAIRVPGICRSSSKSSNENEADAASGREPDAPLH